MNLPDQTFWTDDLGRRWKVPQIKGRLRPGQSAGHRALRDFVIRRDNGRCKACGRAPVASDRWSWLVADHIVSRRNGGSHHPDNLQALCERCNASKAGTVDSRGVAA